MCSQLSLLDLPHGSVCALPPCGVVCLLPIVCVRNFENLATEVSIVSSHLAMPMQKHLEAMLHIMGYLKLKHYSRLALDPSYPNIDQRISANVIE